MKKLGFLMLLCAVAAVLAGCLNTSDPAGNPAEATFTAAPTNTADPFPGDTAAEPMTGEAGKVENTGVDPSSTDAPLADTGVSGM